MLDNFWMGTLAAELLGFYLRQKDRTIENKLRLAVNTFPDDDSLAGMKNRIEALEPIIPQLWVHRGSQQKFVTQMDKYPTASVDTLDVLGNFSATIDIVPGADDFIKGQAERFANRSSGPTGY